ncbi:MAG TPA: metallophosphoesterase [Dermatophilaceae bacterium]|nr:metallophosphoesterase [Dermatophilaceae bacterium]
MTVAGVGAVAYASVIERNAFTLRRFDLPVLPAGAPPIRVLHLTDLHLLPRQRRKIDWVRNLASLAPDLILNTGDNLAHQDAVGPVLEALDPFAGLPGAFVMGANDYYAPTLKNPLNYLRHKDPNPTSPRLPTVQLIRGLTERGWLDLNNARAPLAVRGLDLDMVGVDDPHIGRDRYHHVSAPARSDADLTVGVLHAPYSRVLDAMAADGAGLIIAGHTHGGQLAVPLVGALVTNCDLDRHRAKGITRWWPGANGVPGSHAPADAAWMHVSAGLGTSPYAPVRFACRPEASLLTLRPATD